MVRNKNYSFKKYPITVTNSGGPGVILTDLLESLGVKVPQIPLDVVSILKNKLSPASTYSNPIDIAAEASASEYYEVLNTILKLNLGPIIVIHNPPPQVSALDVAKAVIEVWDSYDRSTPLITYLSGFHVKETKKYLV